MHGLGQVVIGAEFEAEDLVEVFVACREHQDDAFVLLAYGSANLEAVLAGQHYVENDEFGILGKNSCLGRVATYFDGDFEIVLAQVFGGQVGETFVVFNQQDSCFHVVI